MLTHDNCYGNVVLSTYITMVKWLPTVVAIVSGGNTHTHTQSEDLLEAEVAGSLRRHWERQRWRTLKMDGFKRYYRTGRSSVSPVHCMDIVYKLKTNCWHLFIEMRETPQNVQRIGRQFYWNQSVSGAVHYFICEYFSSRSSQQCKSGLCELKNKKIRKPITVQKIRINIPNICTLQNHWKPINRKIMGANSY